MSGGRERAQEARTEGQGAAGSWLRAETFESLAELNEQCLALLRDEAAACGALRPPLLVSLADLWEALDAPARRRAAACPYLLLDAGFADARRWRWVRGHEVHEPEREPDAFFTLPRAAEVLRLALIYAWHLARSQPVAARLFLGMPARCAELLAGCTLGQVTELAERHPAWLQPRWPGRVQVWRELLVTAIAGEDAALEQARMRGVQLLAAELRAASPA